MLNLEGEEHRRLRQAHEPGLLAAAHRRRSCPGSRRSPAELIDAFAEPGRCEFMAEFAEPVRGPGHRHHARPPRGRSGAVIARSRPPSAWPWGSRCAPDLPRIEQALASLYGYADELIADRRRQPADDFVTALVQAHDEGEPSGAGGTQRRRAARRAGAAGLRRLRHHPQPARPGHADLHGQPGPVAAARRAPRSSAAQAVEEVMRVNPTVTWVTREALEDFTFEGLDIAAGTTVHLFAQCGRHRPARVPPTAGFDITAERQPHFGFGGGVHHCLGHFVARGDMGEALPLLARRLRRPASRRRGAVAARLRQHRPGQPPARLHTRPVTPIGRCASKFISVAAPTTGSARSPRPRSSA